MIKFDLGGIGLGKDGYQTVNLAAKSDIESDITCLDNFCDDSSVNEFFLSHTLEHIPILEYKKFLLNMKKKLVVGGVIKVIQTDAEKVIKLWIEEQISFRTMRTTLFPPANRAEKNILLQHQNMWSQEELIKDFQTIGMSAEGFDAGSWKFDVEDDMLPEETVIDFKKLIPNLGVIATKC